MAKLEFSRVFLTSALAVALFMTGTGCDDGGGSSKPDVGDNDINTVVCLGDSITDGRCAPDGAPYPSRLADLAKKKVINAGDCGSTTDSGVSRIKGLLSRHKPGYLCILYGINDLTFGRGKDNVINNLRYMIQTAKANKTVPVVATLLPTYDSHGFIAGEVEKVNVQIRDLAKQEKAKLIDLAKEFGSDRSLIQPDGLHPSDAGTQVIAAGFNDRI
jgi:acyl-CoA thioesterase-1